ncbi:PhzF family phenazine biosynthesis protein [Pseudofrankia inefficax]|uniref:PhzF family phenazine biosynthesis protein n=1 Tax=Pseudofrankia inefficax (strain DSM 45817 / CECT 9037 / DDB 130130 / EuI1c) TaxID=298654 RepID=UPI0002D47B34|nr:PhzF family phenazine biosynthesis protein [Pseudofrankia inefficax]
MSNPNRNHQRAETAIKTTGRSWRSRFPQSRCTSCSPPSPAAGSRSTCARRSPLLTSETIFLDDVEKAEISIHNLSRQIPFAGHAAVGAAWTIARLTGHHPSVLRTTGREAESWADSAGVWVRAPLSMTPPWWAERLDDPCQVDDLGGPLSPTQDFTQLWAWIDGPAGIARMRTYAARVGIPEDEACGTGAMRLAAGHGRRMTIHHGEGSIIHAAPGPAGYAGIAGHITEVPAREI